MIKKTNKMWILAAVCSISLSNAVFAAAADDDAIARAYKCRCAPADVNKHIGLIETQKKTCVALEAAKGCIQNAIISTMKGMLNGSKSADTEGVFNVGGTHDDVLKRAMKLSREIQKKG